jgi:hypothetical protein
MNRFIVGFATFALSCPLGFTQISAPSSVPQQQSAPQAGPMATMTFATAQLLDQLLQTSRNTVTDLQHVRVDKWKTDDKYKDRARANSESLQRNLTAALPTLVQQMRANPSSIAASVKLYRNLNAVYDVLESFSESTGAFGSKDDYNALAQDTSNLDNIRRNLADQLEQQATAQDAQMARLAAQVQAQQQAAAAAPPKRVIVDDNAPTATSKKSSTKKKTTSKTATPQ